MPTSSRLKTRSSNKTVLPVGGDSTPVVHAREPALPHITQTLVGYTPTTMDKEKLSLLAESVVVLSRQMS